jgi:hypothetical protein
MIPGACRHCGCTEEDPCTLENGDHCGRYREDVCSKRSCIVQEEQRAAAESRAVPRSKYAGWGYGAVVKDLRRKARKKLRGKGRAA